MSGLPQRSEPAPAPLRLLIQVNLLQAWRRVLSIREQSRLLSLLVALFLAGYCVLAFLLFWRGLRFVGSFTGLGSVLTERLLFLLFAFLFLLLLFSNLVISYTNLFRNRETEFLMSLPVSAHTIFQWKFIESTVLASWAFLFLIAPLLVAFGLVSHVAWHFYLFTLLLIGLFIVLPSVAGAWCAVYLARYLDRRSFQALAFAGAVALLVGLAIWWKPEPIPEEMLETRVMIVLDRLMGRTRFALFPFLPSYWLSAGVLNWSEGALMTAWFFGLVLLSHVLFFGYLAFSAMGRLFYEAASTVQSRDTIFGRWKWLSRRSNAQRRFTYKRGMLEHVFGCLVWLTPDVRALLVKDMRMFWRDTTQWGQTLVLFGLLGIYIINLRHFSHQLTNPFWVNLVSYLNMMACSLNLATLTTRFVYPQFSLEGKRLWIVGMAPIGLERLVRVKFWLASVTAQLLTVSLMWLSCHMLKMSWDRMLFFIVAVSIMAFSLTALALGLGTLYPNFKEDNPSKIVSGFGGTFCLVLSFLYIVGSIAILAVSSPWSRYAHHRMGWILGCWLGFIAWSLALNWVPWKLGLKRLPKFEL